MRIGIAGVILASFGLAVAATAQAPAPGPRFTPEGFRAHVAFLADDRLEGRNAGTRGYDLAALYVASRFEEIGLRQAVAGSWYQQVPLVEDLSPQRPGDKGARRAGKDRRPRLVTSPNVLAILPGSDPALAGEYVLLMAHLDHEGMAEAGEGDRIFNGALDNAAGVAAMIEVARVLAAEPQRPRRSILFAAVTGEEDGLKGSSHLALHPVVDGKMVAAVNLDMPILLYDFEDVVAFGGSESTLGAVVARATAAINVAVGEDEAPEQQLFLRSDHYSFVLRGVPSIFLMTGYAGEGRERVAHYLSTHYHQPSDDPSLPIDWAAGAKFARLNYLIVRDVADAPMRPLWYADSVFGNSYAPSEPKVPRPQK